MTYRAFVYSDRIRLLLRLQLDLLIIQISGSREDVHTASDRVLVDVITALRDEIMIEDLMHRPS